VPDEEYVHSFGVERLPKRHDAVGVLGQPVSPRGERRAVPGVIQDCERAS
jgi:hypothetical protein